MTLSHKYPWLTSPLILFGGLIKIPMFSYYWVMTSAQLELMACDQPIVIYNVKEKKHSKKEMEELTRRWQKKKNMEESRGEHFDIKNFLNTREAKPCN